MKRLIIFSLVFIVLLSAFVSAEISVATDCTDDVIKATWDSIFVDSVTSDDIVIYKNDVIKDGKCEKFFAKKKSGDVYYFLIGYVEELDIGGETIDRTGIYARYADLTADGIVTLDDIGDIDTAELQLFPEIGGLFTYEDEVFFTTNINLRDTALTEGDNTEFGVAFKETPDTWDGGSNYAGSTEYRYADDQSTSTEKIFYTGALNNDYVYNKFTYSYRLLTAGENGGGDDTAPPESGCTPDWDCSGFGDCVDGAQTQTCSDLNSCGDDSNKPSETQTCTPDCIPSWDCSGFGDCVDEVQTQTCTDDNDCGTTAGKPSENQTCTPEPSNIGGIIFYILMGVFAIIMIVTIVFIIKSILSHSQETSSSNLQNTTTGLVDEDGEVLDELDM